MDYFANILLEASKEKKKPKLMPDENTTNPKDLLPNNDDTGEETKAPKPKEEDEDENTTDPKKLLPTKEEPKAKETETPPPTEDADENTTNPSDLLPSNDSGAEDTDTGEEAPEGGEETPEADENTTDPNDLLPSNDAEGGGEEATGDETPEGTPPEEGEEAPEGEEQTTEEEEDEGPLSDRDKLIQKRTQLEEFKDLLKELQYSYDVVFKYLNNTSLQDKYNFILSDIISIKQLIINYINLSFISDTNIVNKMKFTEFVLMYELILDSVKKIKENKED